MDNFPTVEDFDKAIYKDAEIDPTYLDLLSHNIIRKFDKIIYDLVKSWPDALHLLTQKYIIDHPDLALVAVSVNGLSIRYLPTVFKEDLNIVHIAVLNHSDAFQFASKELQENKDILLAKSANNVKSIIDEKPHLITFSKSLQRFYSTVGFRDMLGRRYYHYSLEYIKYFSSESNSYISIFSLIFKINNYVIIYASDKLINNPSVMLKVVSEHGTLLEYVSNEIKDNFNIVLKAVQSRNNGLPVFQFASERLHSNRDIVSAAVIRDETALKFAANNLRDDYDIVFASVSHSGISLEFASDRLRDDRDILSVAVSNDGDALQFASDRFRDDRDIVLAVVTEYPYALEFASDRLRDDEDIVSVATTANGIVLKFASDRLRDDRDFVYKLLKDDPLVLQHASDRLCDDQELVMCAITNVKQYTEYVFQRISQRLRTNHNTILHMISKNPYVIEYVDFKIKRNLNIMLASIDKSIDAIQYYYPTYTSRSNSFYNDPTYNKILVRDFIRQIMTNSINFKLACGQSSLEYYEVLPVDDIESQHKKQKTTNSNHTFTPEI